MLFQGKPKTDGAPPQKSGRIPIAIPVTITGKDAAGRSFKEATHTVEIDRQGGRILTFHQLAVGAPISIENASLGQTALAKVVNCINRRSRQGPSQVDVELADLPELFEAASIWGVKGRGEPAASAEDRETAPQEAHSAQPPAASTSEPEPAVLAPHTTAARPADELPPIAATQAAPPRPPTQTVVQPLPAAGPSDRESGRLAKENVVAELQKVRLEMQASFESRAAEQQRQLAEMAASGVREVQRKSDVLVQEFQGRLEDALQEIQQKGMTEAAEELRKIVENSKEAAGEHLAKQADTAVASLNEQIKKSATAAAGDTEQRLASLSEATVEAVKRHATATEESGHRLAEALAEQVRAVKENTQAAAGDAERRLAALSKATVETVARQAQAATEEWRSRLELTSEEQARRIEENRVAALAAVQAAGADSLASVERARQQFEAGFGARAVEYQKRLTELGAVLEGLEERAKNQPVGLPAGSDNSAALLAREDVKQAAESLRSVARDLLEQSARQIEEQVRAASDPVRGGLKAHASALVEEVAQQLSENARTTIESVDAAVEQFSEESRGRSVRAFEERERAADQNAQALLGSIHQATEQFQKDFEVRQEKTVSAIDALNAAAEQATLRIENAQRQAEAGLLEFRRSADGVLERSSQKLHQQAHEAAQQLAEEIRVTGAALAGEKNRELTAMTRAAAESLAQEAQSIGQQSRDELRRVLDEFVSRSAEEVRVLDDARLDLRVENAKRQRATLERLRLECVRLERSALRRIAGLVRDLVVCAVEGVRSSLKGAVKVGMSLAAVAAVFVTYLSIQPVTRLRVQPPKEFYDEYVMLDAKRRPAEEILARAYWDCARLDVQGKYAYGKDLPDDPPANFGVDEAALTRAGIRVDPGSRVRYWARLRLVWLLPQAWEQSYGWHTDWMRPLAARASGRESAVH